MCGILVAARLVEYGPDADFADLFHTLQAANAARGPDAQNLHHISLSLTQPSRHTSSNASFPFLGLDFFASELRLRGDVPIVQPHKQDDDVLCWNGEIFEGLNIAPQENDGVRLFETLRTMDTAEQIRDFFSTIEGPYAFVYYQSRSRRLFFARDPLGRRSLLIHKSTISPQLMLASVSAGADPRYQFEELSTSHIYCLALSQVNGNEFGFDAYLNILPRRSPNPKTCSLSRYAEPSKVNRDLPPSEGFTRVEALQNVPEHLVEAVDSLINHLDRSVMLRTMNVPHYSVEKDRAKVAVLFSGGIDSTMVAFFAHKHAPTDEPIDLLNVAFENPIKIKRRAHGNIKGLNRKQKDFLERNSDMMKHATNPGSLYMVPDRETGLEEVEELRKLCPERVWNFVEINVPYSESQAARPKIEALMFPRRTVMDMSLALALYFAAKGQGQIRPLPEAEPIPYRSQARVLLNGLGSDELLGGYGRHRSAFNTGGWECAIEELQLELDRIPTRNLGRDDRVISSQGKETRHPFLSLTLVDFLARLPIHFKMDPRLELGVGDKMLLRLAARKLGLVGASERKKRAMQFGTHSARMDGERRGDALLD